VGNQKDPEYNKPGKKGIRPIQRKKRVEEVEDDGDEVLPRPLGASEVNTKQLSRTPR
jgi:hypothetical protein